MVALAFSTADAQSILNRLGKAAKRAAERTVENRVERETEKAVDKALDKAVDGITQGVSGEEVDEDDGRSSEERLNDAVNKKAEEREAALAAEQEKYAAARQARQAVMDEHNAQLEFDDWDIAEEDVALMRGQGASAGAAGTAGANSAASAKPQNTRATTKYNKFDFVAGDEIIFEDNLAGEQLGEFPSQWDLLGGVAEIAEVDGQNVIAMEEGAKIRPYMEPIHDYLGDVFTIEFDYYQFLEQKGEDYGYIEFYLKAKDSKDHIYGTTILDLEFNNFYQADYYGKTNYSGTSTTDFRYSWQNTSDGRLSGNNDALDVGPNNWVHVSISFNKRALKIYVNETRIANIPNMSNQSGFLYFSYGGAADGFPAYIRNVRVAKGAVPLYDRMMTDGKFITYGITFDVGKSVIKDESMGEINRIVKLMTDNPDLKFSVEGHTDNTGSAANNQKLSEARSKAIVDKLVEMGIASSRLSASGKGQNAPIADNGTEEGRAKNRRVEFVKQ